MARRSTSSSSKQALGLPSYLNVPPRFGTLRNFDNPTYGDRLALTARLLGKPFIPWQQYVADVLGEVDPRTGIRVYREGLVTLMRQGGKTTFIVGFKSHRALDCTTPQTIQFAAQDGIEAKKKWLQHAKLIKRTPLGARLIDGTPTTSNGKEILEWDTGSTEIPLSGAEGSGHGDTLNLGVITEAFAHKDDRYMLTMRPAMNNDPSAQLLVESTQGTAASIWLNETTTEYRERITADPAEMTESRIAYFDWSFADDDDIGSPETWRRRIPQLGHLLRVEEVETAWRNATTPKKIRAFKRGYGNVADLGAGEGSLFDETYWEDTETNDIIVGLRALTFDVTNDRSWSSLAWAGINQAGAMQSELIKHDRSVHWVVTAAGAIFDRNPKMRRRIYCAPGGQAVTLEAAFKRAEIEMIILSRSEYAGAAGQYYAGCGDGDELESDEPEPRIFHTAASGQTPLHVAIAGAAWTTIKPRVWDHARSTTVMSPLVACSIAPWAYQIELEAQPVDDILQTIA
ncbi:hypothetical protein JNB63_02090 [Microbacterium trichothecenolyticum]|uniref:terminase large subunit n=1 Tax=Microbacterium trichothecenolyticum TaxID=69370 RepID=UPI001C6DDFC5|nr:terminase large subunit [Microbacterium trichothecenolyticum]MBW9118876.1 hypothetical protein [Microbacterium trichothecenolyticum]